MFIKSLSEKPALAFLRPCRGWLGAAFPRGSRPGLRSAAPAGAETGVMRIGTKHAALVPKLSLGTHLLGKLSFPVTSAKYNFADKGVPKCNLGTRGTPLLWKLSFPVTSAKSNFADKGVPKCNLGTREPKGVPKCNSGTREKSHPSSVDMAGWTADFSP